MFGTNFGIAPAAIDPDLCDQIILAGEKFDSVAARVGGSGLDLKTRDSHISWFTPEQAEKHNVDIKPFYDTLHNAFSDICHECGWADVELTKSQAFQYTKYTGGGFYDWHPDQHKEPYEKGHKDEGLMRKFSFTLLLNDPDEYKGGDFWLEDTRNGGPHTIWHRVKNLTAPENHRLKGTMIAFPSYLWHKVYPVTAGERRSLVCWFLGPPWR